MREVELLVIGAGPAGVAAARSAFDNGTSVLLVDERPREPALLRRNIPYWFGAREGARERREDLFRWLTSRPDLTEAFEQGVEFLAGHSAWGVFPDRVVGLYDADQQRTFLVRAAQIVLASGATDLHLAFPGWTRGGVLGALGARYLLEAFGHLDARRIVVLGSGNLGLAVARAAARSGVEIAAIVDIASETRADAAIAAELASGGAPFYPRHMIVEAAGGADVEEVHLRPLDGGPGVHISADCVCVAIGQQPAVDLAPLAGCQLDFDSERGGWYPRHDDLQRTTAAGVLVAGDAAGALDAAVLDPAVAQAQGRAAGLAVAGLAHAPSTVVHSRSTDGAYATEWHRLADEWSDDDLLVCRCEEVSRGTMLAAAELASSTYPDEVKRVSRAGMGLCQGRGCRPLVGGVLAARAGRAYAGLQPSSYRPPLRPIALAALASEDGPPVPHLPAFDEAAARLARAVEARVLNPFALTRFRRSAEELVFKCLREELPELQVRQLAAELEAHIRATQVRNVNA